MPRAWRTTRSAWASPATIVMPRFASAVKVERTRGFGATVVLEGDTFDDARAHGLAAGAGSAG